MKLAQLIPRWSLTVFFLFQTLPVLAFTPMEYFNTLEAGGPDAGFQDGSFDEARFDKPAGLAFDGTGDRLFVSDQENNRIRVIYRNQNNRVETLAGTGVAGKADGPATMASFNKPQALAYLPDDSLVVYDSGDQSLRQLDLKTGNVTTLLAVGVDVWNIVYRAKDKCLYFSEPNNGNGVVRLDPVTKKTSVVFSSNPLVPNPKALCVNSDKLYVADWNLPNVYEVLMDTKDPVGAPVSATLNYVAKGERVHEMAFTDNILYAIQQGNTPLARLTPDYVPVTLATSHDYLIAGPNDNAETFMHFDNQAVGLAVFSGEPRKLYLSNAWESTVMSVKDYDFGATWPAEPAFDYSYPEHKPTKTYRILVVGDSRLVTSPTVVNGANYTPSQRINTCAKQLELILNTEAALKGVDTHFEVLMIGHVNQNPLIFGNYEVPDLVKRYDVDMVLMLTSMKITEFFFQKWTAEGIPVKEFDSEYILKPIKERIPPGAPKKFYDDCKKKGYINEKTSFADYPPLLRLWDLEIREDIMSMYDLPLKLLKKKLAASKGPTGAADLVIGYVPWNQLGGKEKDFESFWKDLCARNGIGLLDISKPYNVLRVGFYPTQQECCSRHYTAYGNNLIALLFSRALIEQKLIPFETAPAKGDGKK